MTSFFHESGLALLSDVLPLSLHPREPLTSLLPHPHWPPSTSTHTGDQDIFQGNIFSRALSISSSAFLCSAHSYASCTLGKTLSNAFSLRPNLTCQN